MAESSGSRKNAKTSQNESSGALVSQRAEGNDVAQNQAVEGAQPPEHQPSKLESFMAVAKTLIIRGLIIYFITSFFRRPQAPTTGPDPSGVGSPVIKQVAENIFTDGTPIDLYVFISHHEHRVNFDDPDSLKWIQTDLKYGDWKSGPNGDGTYSHGFTIESSETLRNNGSIFLHAYVVPKDKSPNPKDPGFAGKKTLHLTHRLNKYRKRKFMKTRNLLTGETEMLPEDIIKAETMTEEIVSHWHPNLTINLVVDETKWQYGSVPPPLDEFIFFISDNKQYKPIIYANDFWNMYRDYYPINKSTEMLDLYLTYQPLSLIKWQLYVAQTMRNKWNMGNQWTSDFLGGEEDDESKDSFKETLLETSPYLLGITVVVTILHSIFELLAFKNDIQFWKNRKSLEGLSVRSVFFNVFQTLIVLLYVLDNETNFLVRVSCFVGLGIEIWKIHKVVDVKIKRDEKVLGIFPKITFEDKGSYVESSTRQYDLMAFRYLSWLCFPLLGGYAVYSLLYQEHKGWYSFILNMLYGFLLTFGFIVMTPQLFINYKLKSVAHLPWRMMTYKFLNTFIDDIFAFVIKMPTLYRLGCFRDDIIFFIFLYQRWIYKVDKSRINEFGFSGEMEQEAGQQSVGDTPQAAIESSSVVNTPQATTAASSSGSEDKKNI